MNSEKSKVSGMKKYGIIGNPLGHSYSEQYFTALFAREQWDAVYSPYAIEEIEEARRLLEALDGANITYPYKEAIIPYLREIDGVAREIGAVNVVHKGKGYNTDWIGFRDSLQGIVTSNDTHALLLGTGGVSKAIQYALKEMGIGFTVVSRCIDNAREVKGDSCKVIGYNEVDKEMIARHQIVVNCTPLGMHPYEEEMAEIPYKWLTKEHLLYDCIYNPEKTRFLQMGEKQGCRTKNGLEMLHLQADEAWKLWK